MRCTAKILTGLLIAVLLMTPTVTEAADRTVDSTTLFVPFSTNGTPTTQFTAEFGKLKPGDHCWTELMKATLQGDERAVKKLLCRCSRR